MTIDTVRLVAEWVAAMVDRGERGPEDVVGAFFHGGEPLVAGNDFYAKALPVLKEAAGLPVRFALQTNLWLGTDAVLGTLAEHGVAVSTSLDGPRGLNDAQRGQGYFEKTMAGLARARSAGLRVGAVCTFTSHGARHVDEIFTFFRTEGIDLAVHSCVPSLREERVHQLHLPPQRFGIVLTRLLDLYLAHLDEIRVPTLDALCNGAITGVNPICTFRDCLGHYLAVGPDGAIYPCQRFAGIKEFRLGHVAEMPSLGQLETRPVWRLLAAREANVHSECGDCPHFAFCRGGCPYNALAAGGGSFSAGLRDPECAAYRPFFHRVKQLAEAEFVEQFVTGGDTSGSEWRKTPLLAAARRAAGDFAI